MTEDEVNRQRFIVSASPETVVSNPEFEGVNSSRFAIVGLLTPDARDGLIGIEDEILGFGFNERFVSHELRNGFFGESRADSRNVGDFFANYENRDVLRSEAWMDLNDGNLAARIAFLAAGLCSDLERESAAAAVAMIGTLGFSSVPTLDQISVTSQFWNYVDFMEPDAYMFPNSPLPYYLTREILDEVSQSARKWDTLTWPPFDVRATMTALGEFPFGKTLQFVLNDIAWMRIRLAFRSTDEVSRQFVDVLNSRPRVWGKQKNVVRGASIVTRSNSRPSLTSTMLHGTWGWRGDWWHPDGSFYKFVRKDFRPRLYDGGQEFSWSGAYSDKDRRIAGDRLKRWIEAQDPGNGLGSVFAHSYGAEVVARAINDGAKVDELVFLSAPVNEHLEEAVKHVAHAVDVRLRFDIVLCLAAVFRRPNQSKPRQKFRANVPITEFRSKYYYWHHGLTHNKWFWKMENVASKTGFSRVP